MRESLPCINDFQNLYGSLLDAVERKDKDWLEANVHRDLVLPFLQTKNIFQLNKNMPLNILFNSFHFYKGVNLNKYYQSDSKSFFKYNFGNQFLHIDFFNKSLKKIATLAPKENTYAVCFKVVFVSSRKLSQRKDGMHQKLV